MSAKVNTAAAKPAVASPAAMTPRATTLATPRAGIASAAQRLDQALDAFIAWAEAIFPSLSVLGAFLLMYLLFMGLTGGAFAAPDDTHDAQQEATGVAAGNAPGQPAF